MIKLRGKVATNKIASERKKVDFFIKTNSFDFLEIELKALEGNPTALEEFLSYQNNSIFPHIFVPKHFF